MHGRGHPPLSSTVCLYHPSHGARQDGHMFRSEINGADGAQPIAFAPLGRYLVSIRLGGGPCGAGWMRP
jgi:hypothetical protein